MLYYQHLMNKQLIFSQVARRLALGWWLNNIDSCFSLILSTAQNEGSVSLEMFLTDLGDQSLLFW